MSFFVPLEPQSLPRMTPESPRENGESWRVPAGRRLDSIVPSGTADAVKGDWSGDDAVEVRFRLMRNEHWMPVKPLVVSLY